MVNWFRLLKTFLGLIIIGVIVGQSAVAHADIIRAIDVTGNRTVSADTIRATIRSRPGEAVSAEKISQDIKALFSLGQFMDVRIEESGGVLKIILRERPTIRDIKFEGNKKIKDDAFKDDLTVKAFSPLDGKDLATTMEKMRERYAKKGYYVAQIDYKLIPVPNTDEMDLILVVDENDKAVIRKISFIGNHVFKDSQLKKMIRSKEKGFLSFISGAGKYNNQQLEQDVMMMTFTYLNKGYIKIKIDNPRVDISKDKKSLFITYRIEEGHQYRINQLRVGGDILTTSDQIVSMIKTKPKQIYNQQQIEEDVHAITDLYGDEGYAFVNVQPVPETHEDDTADITFNIDKGPRVKIERINIIGNTVTRDKVIRREMRVKEGDLYNQRLIELSKQKIQQLGYFEEINFATPRGSRDDTLVLNITLKEKPTGTFNVGAGFSTGEKFILQGSIAKENFFGYGVGGQASVEYSSRRQQYSLTLTDPYFLDSNWLVGANAYKSVYRYTDFQRESLGGGVNLGRRFFTNASMNIGYQYEDIKARDFVLAVPNVFLNNATGRTSQVSLTLAHDTRDNRIFTKKGWLNSITTEYSGNKLGGTNNFWRSSYMLRYYQPIAKTGVTWKTFARVGYIKGLNDTVVPLFERYFLGGPNSLRGYYPRTIGPTILIPGSTSGPEGGFNYGGNKMMQFNVELELPIYNPAGFKFVTFFDAGNAFSEDQKISFTNLRSDYGFGLRWLSPMGPLRFEWGFPINKQPGEDGVVFNFTIGDLF